jgi:hypothetical protein
VRYTGNCVGGRILPLSANDRCADVDFREFVDTNPLLLRIFKTLRQMFLLFGLALAVVLNAAWLGLLGYAACPTTWLASVNASYLGEYFDRTTAMARVEDAIKHHMRTVLEDWALYRTTKDEGAA